MTYSPITNDDERDLKKQILAAPGITISNLVSVAWGSASTFRGGDKRGGANGARIALQPQVSWAVNNPQQLQTVLSAVCFVPLPPLSQFILTTYSVKHDQDQLQQETQQRQQASLTR